MSKPNIILIGAGGHASACIDVIEQQGRYNIAGLVGLSEEVNTQQLGHTVIATDNELPELANEYEYTILAIGQIKSPTIRMRLYEHVTELGFKLPVIVSPIAHVSTHANVGMGSIVMHGAIVNAGAKVGSNCIINTRAIIEHNASVEDHCHISTGAILNGGVNVGEGSFVGSGGIIRDGISIGEKCVIGMGVSVRHDLGDHTKISRPG